MKIEELLLKQVFEKEPVIVLIGQSGSGKGTIQKRFINLHKRLLRGKPFLCLETGQLFRDIIPTMSDVNIAALSGVQDSGKFQPWIIAATLSTATYLMLYKGGLVIVDGSPRSAEEVTAMVNLYLHFAKKEIIIINFKLSDKEADKRMVIRNKEAKKAGKPLRGDMLTAESRAKKIAEFYTGVVPGIEAFRLIPNGVTIYDIDASLSKRAVLKNILSLLTSNHA